MSQIKDKKIFFIVNPMAGGRRANSKWESFLPKLEASGLDFFWEYTSSSGSAGEQIRHAVLQNNAEVIIVFGGDGTLFEVVNGLILNDKLIREEIILGVCSAGSACDFTRFAYTGFNGDALDMLERGQIKYIDVGRCSFMAKDKTKQIRYYLNSCDMGAGADTCYAVNANNGLLKKLLRGKLAFLLSALKVLMSFKYTNTHITCNEEKYSGEYIIAGVGNGMYAGSGMKLFPNAELCDGKLDILLVSKRSRLEILRIFTKVYSGEFIHEKDVSYLQAALVSIETDLPVLIELDGELVGYTNAEVSVLPSLLPLLQIPLS